MNGVRRWQKKGEALSWCVLELKGRGTQALEVQVRGARRFLLKTLS